MNSLVFGAATLVVCLIRAWKFIALNAGRVVMSEISKKKLLDWLNSLLKMSGNSDLAHTRGQESMALCLRNGIQAGQFDNPQPVEREAWVYDFFTPQQRWVQVIKFKQPKCCPSLVRNIRKVYVREVT